MRKIILYTLLCTALLAGTAHAAVWDKLKAADELVNISDKDIIVAVIDCTGEKAPELGLKSCAEYDHEKGKNTFLIIPRRAANVEFTGVKILGEMGFQKVGNPLFKKKLAAGEGLLLKMTAPDGMPEYGVSIKIKKKSILWVPYYSARSGSLSVENGMAEAVVK